jgi:hypothetical protein
MAQLLTIIIGLFLSYLPNSPESPAPRKGPAGIDIRSERISSFDLRDSSLRRFGALEFRGGLVLKSVYSRFGGFSAIRVKPDGSHFIALSDRGFWLSGCIVYAADHPAGVTDAFMAPVLDSQGKSSDWDTESLAEDGGTLYAGIERINRIMRFAYRKNGLHARAQPVPVPPELRSLPNNQGLEGLVFVPRKYLLGGTLIAFSEQELDPAGNLIAFLIGGPHPGLFAVKRTDDYDISDAALLPDGNILILERHLSLIRGVSLRIRRISAAEIKPRAVVDGPTLIEADMRCQIDNMEALSVHSTPSGATVLTLMSDDNFSPLQRTLLLQFTLK